MSTTIVVVGWLNLTLKIDYYKNEQFNRCNKSIIFLIESFYVKDIESLRKKECVFLLLQNIEYLNGRRNQYKITNRSHFNVNTKYYTLYIMYKLFGFNFSILKSSVECLIYLRFMRDRVVLCAFVGEMRS